MPQTSKIIDASGFEEIAPNNNGQKISTFESVQADYMTGISKDFNPGITHPAWLIRSRLLKGIRAHAAELHGRLMDFGCGSKPYRSLFTNISEYIGVDYDSPGHPHTNEDIDIYYDGKTLPFPDNHFDSIFTTEVFEHIFNLADILKELNRVLRPGGKILITCPFAICEHEVPNDFARYTSFAMEDMLEKNNFTVTHLGKTGNAIETIWQIRITHWHQHILPIFRKIPVVRSGMRLLVYTGMNCMAAFWSRVLPNSYDLYLNNLVLAQKNS
ncbi:MAG: methyltransferase domain-containing protein [Sphingobacteriales bacterium]|nr:methyltransferase domain-containing protein [Sphingobacteriales bacterium]NCT73691.1 methyltransferase domain-containing protein [Chitinophagaceae bacterium]